MHHPSWFARIHTCRSPKSLELRSTRRAKFIRLAWSTGQSSIELLSLLHVSFRVRLARCRCPKPEGPHVGQTSRGLPLTRSQSPETRCSERARPDQ